MKTSDSGKSGRKSKPLIKNIYPANFFHIIAPFRILFFNNSRTISTTANTSPLIAPYKPMIKSENYIYHRMYTN